jgi:hypothetical protein
MDSKVIYELIKEHPDFHVNVLSYGIIMHHNPTKESSAITEKPLQYLMYYILSSIAPYVNWPEV